MLVFMKGGKPEYPEKNPRDRDENQQQTQPTYDAETENRTGPHWREANAQPLRHPCLTIILIELVWFAGLLFMRTNLVSA